MFLKQSQNKGKVFWTRHAKEKMRYYRLSEKRVLRILRKPDRKEESIVEGALANMQIAGTKKKPTEIWVMYVILAKPKGVKIISCWRYPGRTAENQRPLIPEDLLKEILKEVLD
jgi:preprotein translocase subunit Sss1